MRGDFTRIELDPSRDYTGILMQQGRVARDDDWNQAAADEEHLCRLAIVRRVLEARGDALDEASIARAFDPKVVITDESAEDDARWEGHDGAGVWIGRNVTPATHGETLRAETLGSGDVFLSLGPRPALFAFGENGIVRIREFARADTALQAAEILDFELSTDEDGTPVVRFGDGRPGRRLPSGRGNVSATYRVGSGSEGNVDLHTVAVGPAAARAGEDQPRLRLICVLLGATIGALLTTAWHRLSR